VAGEMGDPWQPGRCPYRRGDERWRATGAICLAARWEPTFTRLHGVELDRPAEMAVGGHEILPVDGHGVARWRTSDLPYRLTVALVGPPLGRSSSVC